MSDGAPPLAVTATGLLRGQELSGSATVALRGEVLELVTRAARHALPVSSLDGARMLESGALEISVEGGDVLVLFAGINGAASLNAIGELLRRTACALPEFTRALRGLGSPRGRPGAEHDRFFRPLLEARRGAERSPRHEGARLAFDSVSLRAAFTRRLREMAHERYPNAPPERRALEAHATDVAAPLFAALLALDDAQRAVDVATDIERFARWRAWTAALQRVFDRADEGWLALEHVFVAPVRSGGGWRRLLPGRHPEADG
jgi:hypothetical protein